MTYYMYRAFGYEEDDLTYLTIKDIFECIDKVDDIRNELKGVRTRAYEAQIKKRPKFSDDLKKYIKERDENGIKERWRNIKGLDGDV